MKHLNKFDKFSVKENYEEIEEISLEEDDILDAEVAAELEAEEMAEEESDEMVGEIVEDEECSYEETDEYAYEGLTKFDDFKVVNEEGSFRKTFTGVSDDEEQSEFKSKMEAELAKYESDPNVFVSKSIRKEMEDNDYIGSFSLGKRVSNSNPKLAHINGKQILKYEKGMSPAKRAVRGAFGLSTDKDKSGYRAGQSSFMK